MTDDREKLLPPETQAKLLQALERLRNLKNAHPDLFTANLRDVQIVASVLDDANESRSEEKAAAALEQARLFFAGLGPQWQN